METFKRKQSERYCKEQELFLSAPDLVYNFQEVDEQNSATEGINKSPTQKNENLEAWLVLFSVVMFNVIMGYHYLTFSLYYVTFTEVFNTTKATAGFINSIQGFSASILSIFGSALIELFGMRKVAVFGCMLLSLGTFASAFATNIYVLYISYGFIVGCGISLASLSSMVLIQEHFHKNRSLATSVAVCGSSVGSTISPFITNILLDTFGWRGCLVMHSGILLNTVVLSLTYWPVKVQQTKKVKPGVTNFFRSLGSSFAVLKRKSVILLTCSIVLMRFNTKTYYDHIPSRLVFIGYDLNYAGYIVSILGFANLTARLICTIIAGFHLFNPIFAIGLATFVQSVSQLLSTAFSTFLPIAIISAFYGSAQGFIVPANQLSVVKISGVENFAKTRAVIGIFGSISTMMATPITGWMFDITQNYKIPFYVGGTMGLMGCLCFILVFITQRMEVNDEKAATKLNNTTGIQLQNDRSRTMTC